MADIEQIIAQCSAVFQESLGNTYGALYIGVVSSVFFLGITNLQVYMYFQRYGDDRLWYKLSVIFLWIQDTSHTVLITHALYWYLVSNYFKPWGLIEIPWSFKLQVDMNAFCVYTVHLLYYVRMWKLIFVPNIRDSLWVKLWCALITVFLISAGALVGVMVWAINTMHQTTDYPKISWITFAILANATTLDIMFASSFCAHLARYRKANFSGFTGSAAASTIIAYTVSTNLLTSLCSLSVIILCAAMPHNYIFLAVELLLTKLYVNSYMAMLNARTSIKTSAVGSAAGVPTIPLYNTGRITNQFSKYPIPPPTAGSKFSMDSLSYEETRAKHTADSTTSEPGSERGLRAARAYFERTMHR